MIKKSQSNLNQLSKAELINLVDKLQKNNSTSEIDNETLFNSNNILNNTIASMNDGFVCLDEVDKIIFINQKGLDLFDRDYNSIIGKNIWQDLNIKKGNLFFDNYYRAIEQNKPITFENYSKTSKKWFRNRVIPSNSNVSIFFEDITEVHESEKITLENNHDFNKNSSVSFLWKNEKNWPVEHVSNNVETIFGYSYDDFISKKITYGEVIHPDDILNVRLEIENAMVRKSFQSFTHKPYRIITKTNQIKWVIEKNQLRYDSNKNVTHFQGFIEDITERKNLEDTLQQIKLNTSSVVGIDYLNKITIELQKALNADYAFIGFLSDENSIKTISLCQHGKIIDNISYLLPGTPCENVVGKKSCSFPKNIIELFPEDKLLQNLNIEGYVGIPLFNNKSKQIGIVVALYLNPIKNENLAKSIIQIYTSRISAEIQNSKSKELLKFQKEENRILFEEAASPTLILDFSNLKNEINPQKEIGIKISEQFLISNERILSYLREIKILDINKKCLEFFNLSNKIEFLTDFSYSLSPKSILFAKYCLISMLNGNSSFEGEIIIENQIGEKLYLIVKLSIPKIYQKNFKKVILSFTNITERKLVEEIIYNNKQRLEEHLNNTPLASIVWDLNFNCLEWNKSAEKIFGFTSKEAIGKNAFDLIIPKKLSNKVDVLWSSLLKENGGYKISIENTTKTGKIIHCDWYNAIIKDINGNIISIASLANNITQQKRSKKLLKQSEKKYKDIFTKSNDPVFILNNNNTIVDCNKSALQMFGYPSKKELLQLKPSDISPKEQPNGELSTLLENIYIKKALLNGTHSFIWYHKKLNGTIFPVETSLTRIINKNNETSIHSVCRDITEREKKAKIQEVLFNISNAALTIDDFQEFNRLIKQELGSIIDTTNFFIALYNKEKETISTPFMVDELDDIRDFSAKKTLTEYVIKSKKSLLGKEKDILKLIDKGIVKWVGPPCKVWLGVPLTINNVIIGVLTIQSYRNENAYSSDDVTLLEFVSQNISIAIQRKKFETKLKKALKKAEESDLLKSAFLANMSHEIRTPMNGIIGFSELLAEKNISETDRHNYAKIVINSSNQLLSIVNDILDISQIEAGMISLKESNVSLNEIMDNLFLFYNQKATKQNIKLNLQKELVSPNDIITTDDIKLNQILNNLLSNSLKFIEKGTVSFGYTLENSNIQFYVKDTGIGIKEEEQKKVFERFVQAENRLTKKHRGNGLGLSICYKLVELLGGKIWLESEFQKGTTFFFTIPYSTCDIQKFSVKQVEIKEDTNSTNALTILVAEDEEYNRMYLNEIFSKTNHHIIEAKNGQQAIEICLNNSNIDLILMDVKMPILDGLEATKEIKKHCPNLPIIAVSAYAMESDISIAMEAGCNDAISKPINRKKLMALINKYALNSCNANLTS
jgi:PAS domain S-box-containing protein